MSTPQFCNVSSQLSKKLIIVDNVTKKANPIFIALHNQNRNEEKKDDSSKDETSRLTDNEIKREEFFELQENLRIKENGIENFEMFIELKKEKPNIIPKKMKKLKKRETKQKESHFNTGRWQKEEHQRFVEAILKFGNEWKKVQKYVKTRSSTQARSHAQKFFYKIKKNNVLDIDIDINKNSIKTLYEFANKLDEEKYVNTIKTLNIIAFEKNINLNKEKGSSSESNNNNEENFSRYDNSISFFGRSDSFNDDLLLSNEERNLDSLSENTSSSSFKKAHKKDYHKHYFEEDADILNEIEKTLEEQQEQRNKRKRKSSFIMFFPVFDLYNSCDEEDFAEAYDEPMISFQSCFNHFFNKKDNYERFDEEEYVEKYYLLKESKSDISTISDKRKASNKLFASEISNNPNLKKPKKKLFQINPTTNTQKTKINNDFLKQKRIKFATTNNSVEHFMKGKEDVKKSLA